MDPEAWLSLFTFCDVRLMLLPLEILLAVPYFNHETCERFLDEGYRLLVFDVKFTDTMVVNTKSEGIIQLLDN